MSDLKKLLLFDIDGTLADDTHRVHHFLSGDYASYFKSAKADLPLDTGIRLAQKYAGDSDYEVQYLTGRRLDMYEDTKAWLWKNYLPNWGKITMRGFADRDVLANYKVGVLKNAINGGEFASVNLIDDDPEVVRVVNETFGEGTATLATWYSKHPEMIKVAKS